MIMGDSETPAQQPLAGPADPDEQNTGTQDTPDTPDEVGDAREQQLRCLKCYSADLTCREFDKPMTSYGAWLSDPLPVHSKIWTCESCGYEWDDDDNTISG